MNVHNILNLAWIIGGLALGFFGRSLWKYHSRSQALVSSQFRPPSKAAVKFPEGICKDCHGIFLWVAADVSNPIERCSGCGEIRELIDGEWFYHFAAAENTAKTSDNPVKETYKVD